MWFINQFDSLMEFHLSSSEKLHDWVRYFYVLYRSFRCHRILFSSIEEVNVQIGDWPFDAFNGETILSRSQRFLAYISEKHWTRWIIDVTQVSKKRDSTICHRCPSFSNTGRINIRYAAFACTLYIQSSLSNAHWSNVNSFSKTNSTFVDNEVHCLRVWV